MERRSRSTRSSCRRRSVTPAPTKDSGLKKSNTSASDSAKSSSKRSKSKSKARAVSEGRGSRASRSSTRRKTSTTMSKEQQASATRNDNTDRDFCNCPSPPEKRKSDTISQHKKKRSRTTPPVGEDTLDGVDHGLDTASEGAIISPSGQDKTSPKMRKRRHSSKSDTASPGKTKSHKDFVARRKNEEKGQGAWLGTELDNES